MMKVGCLRVGRKLMVVAMVFGVLLATSASAWGAARSFTPRFSTNDTGNIAMVANTLVTCPAAAAQCAAAQAGTATPAGDNNNNAFNMQYVNADPAPGIFNSSSATLSLPAGATVLRAMLYFGADSTAGTSGAAPPDAAIRDQVQFKVPGGSYQSLTAIAPLDFIVSSGSDFQGVVDVTALVGAAGPGTYSVGNVQAGTGVDRQAGWSLVVAYRHSGEPPRNLTIFDGYQVVNSGNPNLTIPVSGFETPPTGPRRTQLGFVAYEGDLGSTGDSVELDTTTLSDATHPADNFFNSSIAIDGVPFTAKSPNYLNQLGFDSSLVRADDILANGATNAEIHLTTGGETYYPGVVTFATELFAPDVTLTKTVDDLDGGSVEPGDTLRYTVTATNDGTDAATDVVITDPIPANTTFVPGSLTPAATSSYDPANDRAVFNVGTGATAADGGTIAAGGGTATATFDVTVDLAPSGTEIDNAARADFIAPALGTPLSVDSNTVTETLTAPDLTIAKLPAVFTATNGGTQEFRLRVSNSGDAPTSGTVTVSDAFQGVPPGAFDSIESIEATGWTCTPAATPAATPATVSCDRSDALPAGSSYEDIVITAHVGALPVDNVVNTATVAGGGDGDTTNNSATSVGQTTSRADVQLLKTVDSATALVGDVVTFTLRVRNGGPSVAEDVQVQDTDLAGNYTVESVSSSVGGCSALPCTLGTMAAGDEATVTIVATVIAAPGAVGNTASVTTTTTDPDPTNDTSTATVDVAPTADLSIAKSYTPDPLDWRAPTAYTVTVHNDGPQAATDVVVTDPLPQGFTFASASAGCTHDPASRTVTCNLGTIASGDDGTVTITGTLAPSTAGTVVSNSAAVTSATGDPDPTNNSTTTTGRVLPPPPVQPPSNPTPPPTSPPGPENPPGTSAPSGGGRADLALTKRTLDDAHVGQRLRYELTVANAGPGSATDVTVTDTLAEDVDFVSATASQGSCSGERTIRCELGDLATGAQATVTVTVVPRATGPLANTATAASPTAESNAANNTDRVTSTVRLAPTRVSVRKMVDRKRVRGGATVGYRIKVRTIGRATARNLRVCDTPPAGLAFVRARGARLDDGRACWTIRRLAADKTRTLRVKMRVAAVSSKRTLTNRVRVTGAQVRTKAGRARLRVLPSAARGGGVTG